MDDVAIHPERVQDPWEKNVPGLGLGRDPERTPMQWDASSQAGFTTGTPWLPVAEDFAMVNVAAEGVDPCSMLTLYRSLIELRRRTLALAVGSCQGIPADGDLLIYRREHGGKRFLIALNLGHRSQELVLDELAGRVVISTHFDRDDDVGPPLALRGVEGVVIELRRRSNHQS